MGRGFLFICPNRGKNKSCLLCDFAHSFCFFSGCFRSVSPLSVLPQNINSQKTLPPIQRQNFVFVFISMRKASLWLGDRCGWMWCDHTDRRRWGVDVHLACVCYVSCNCLFVCGSQRCLQQPRIHPHIYTQHKHTHHLVLVIYGDAVLTLMYFLHA